MRACNVTGKVSRNQDWLITKRILETVAICARDLKLDLIDQGIDDQLTTFREILAKQKLDMNEAALIGDDVIDVPVIMWNFELAIAVAKARAEMKKGSHYITPHGGSDGACVMGLNTFSKHRESGVGADELYQRTQSQSLLKIKRWARTPIAPFKKPS